MPVKYILESIGFEVKYISAVNLASLKAAHTIKKRVILHPNEFNS